MLRKVEKYADQIVCNPPQAHLHERSFISRQHVCSPISIDNINIINSSKFDEDIIKVLHAPSKGMLKGTETI
ncbi:MAG: hypothetical protein R6U35_03185, partial [Candidatus Humimicrobiaceae bacterium]